MNKKVKWIIGIIVIISILVILVCFYYKKNNKTGNKESSIVNTEIEEVDWNNLEDKTLDSDSLTITEEGVYTLTGEINGTVTVNTKGNVKIILDNVTIKSSNGPAIYIESADNTVIYLKEGTTNILEDSSSYSNLDEDISAVIFSKDDLVLDGTGTLTVKANYEDGIVSKDDLKIINGTYTITALDDGIRGKDSVYIIDGNFDINAGGDGIKSSNDTDNEKGYVLIENGKFNINSKSDGIQAITKLVINNGTFNIKSSEGLEATYVVINDGTIIINASDDGINASTKSTFMIPTIEINGGSITISMGQGDTDALDVNGNLYINGGKINITAQSPFDYDKEGKLNGGEVVVNGEKVTELTKQMMGGGMMGRQQGQMPPDMQEGNMQGRQRGGMRQQ